MKSPNNGVYFRGVKADGRNSNYTGERVFGTVEAFFCEFASVLDAESPMFRRDDFYPDTKFPHNCFCVRSLPYMKEEAVHIDADGVIIALKSSEDLYTYANEREEVIALDQFIEEAGREFQEFLDFWSERNVKKQLKPDYTNEVSVPWCEWFGVEERI